jgi:hypothetical protein
VSATDERRKNLSAFLRCDRGGLSRPARFEEIQGRAVRAIGLEDGRAVEVVIRLPNIAMKRTWDEI